MRRSRSRVVMWSVFLHGLAIVALWAVLAGKPQQLKDETPVIAVDLVALAQSAPATSAGPAQPTTQPIAQPADPQPVAPTPPVVRQPERPTPAPRVEAKPVRTPAPKAEAVPSPPEPLAPTAPSAPAQSTTSQSSATSSPASSAPQPAAGGGNASGQPSANMSATAKASYAQLVLARLRRAIIYPRRAARRNIEGEVRVEIVLAASGALRRVRILETSGSDILDEAALKLVRRVSPFPAVPRTLSPGGEDIAFNTNLQYRLN